MRVRYCRSPRILEQDLIELTKFYLNYKMHELKQQLRASAPTHNSLQNGYRMEELLERSPTLPQTYQTIAGNDGNHRIKSTVNSTRVRRTEVDNRENISLSMGCGISNQRPSLPINITRNG
ncbi:hypothetical protein F511_24048 [Dorcoceras hygrometricum]|uniref:Uncharacterized protein n=1 Tax=Dorcoceras hygrometricum TaxID=472368 RepID=A0A2Z7D2M0_9LAMI|nr:hypothetical protein F511_24048 [Dorcoceras hygrometricum]